MIAMIEDNAQARRLNGSGTPQESQRLRRR
jgi:hypothetical protein